VSLFYDDDAANNDDVLYDDYYDFVLFIQMEPILSLIGILFDVHSNELSCEHFSVVLFFKYELSVSFFQNQMIPISKIIDV